MTLVGDALGKQNGRSLAIHPFEPANSTGGGYDLSIGYWLVGQFNEASKKIELLEHGSGETATKTISVPCFGYLAIIAKEYIYLGDNYVGTIHSKAGLSSKGLMLNSTTVDPMWSGRMTFLLRNFSHAEVNLNSASTFGTILLHKVARTKSKQPLFPEDALTRVVQNWQGDLRTAEEYLRSEGESKEQSAELQERKHAFGTMVRKVQNRHTSFFGISWKRSSDEQERGVSVNSSWRIFSLSMAIFGALSLLLISLLPAAAQFWTGISLILFFTIVMVFLWMNPANFYKRLIVLMIAAGSGYLALGGAVELYSESIPYLDRLEIRFGNDPFLFVGWILVTVLLVLADLKISNSKS